MSRYRKSMRQAIEEGLSNMQIAILKKEYAPFVNRNEAEMLAKSLIQKNIDDFYHRAWVITKN